WRSPGFSPSLAHPSREHTAGAAGPPYPPPPTLPGARPRPPITPTPPGVPARGNNPPGDDPEAAEQEMEEGPQASRRSRAGDGRVDDLGDSVGVDPGVRAVGDRAGRRQTVHGHPVARRRPATDTGDRGRAGRGVLVLFVCGCGIGPLAAA